MLKRLLNTMIKNITIDELKIGMYVKDVTWGNDKFKVKTQGIVKSTKTIEQLKKQGVVSLVVEYSPAGEPTEMAVDNSQAETEESQSTSTTTDLKTSIEQELSQSCVIYDNAAAQMNEMFEQVKTGKALNAAAINELASEITDSIIRNEYAITMLTRIRSQSTYQWEHAINCSVLLCGFSLYLGLKKETAQQIALGGMLKDVGMAKVPPGIIQNPAAISDFDMKAVKNHVKWGLEANKKDGLNNKIVTDMVVNHHERLDGSGYPRGIAKNSLSKLARMTAIVDVYDAFTGDKPYKPGEPPISALRYLMSNKHLFDQDLVQQFVKYLGIHPVGSVVKLSNDKLAIVTQGNRKNPVKPQVKTFYNLKHNRYTTSTDCDLAEEDHKIIASVNPEDHNINLNKVIRDVIS